MADVHGLRHVSIAISFFIHIPTSFYSDMCRIFVTLKFIGPIPLEQQLKLFEWGTYFSVLSSALPSFFVKCLGGVSHSKNLKVIISFITFS